MGILKVVGLECKTPLTWMIWGYPYFRKPPYTAHQDVVDTASGGSDWCNGEYSRCECESGGSKNVNLIIYISFGFQDILQETIANQSPNATKRVIVSIMEVSSTSLGTERIRSKNGVITRGHRKRDAGIVHWISQMQQLDVIRCVYSIYLNIS